jgi:hypothetical protein
MLAFCRAQRPPYLPAQAGIAPGPGGGSVLTVELAGPSPSACSSGTPDRRKKHKHYYPERTGVPRSGHAVQVQPLDDLV